MDSERKHLLREWVMVTHGDGRRVACAGCGNLLERRFMTLDRYPIPGFMGGTYRRDNVRPMCAPCNHSNKYTPTEEWVRTYARENGIKLRRKRSAQYSAKWYEEHRPAPWAPLMQSLKDSFPIAAYELHDLIEQPDFNPATQNNRGDWSLRDVSTGGVRAGGDGKPACKAHGAMNCVVPDMSLWRCLMCGRAAYVTRRLSGNLAAGGEG